MLKPGKYLRSKDNGHIYNFDPKDFTLPNMEVVYVDAEGQVSMDPPAAIEDMPEDELVGPPEPEDEEPEEESKPTKLKRPQLEELYLKKYGRKPHPSMRLPRLRQAVMSESSGNDPSAVNPE
jgi:hypothetical protein